MNSVKFSSVIDALTDSIQRFGVTRDENTFESQLNFIMSKMDKVVIEIEDKWDVLQSNYSKLKYLYELCSFYNMPTEGVFVRSLEFFCESMDKQTQDYLSQIDWDSQESDFRIEGRIIKKCMEKSLQRGNVYEKIADILKAYEILVCIVEDIRGEKYEYYVEPEFVKEFQPPQKRRKV
jgi:hypothetical protein